MRVNLAPDLQLKHQQLILTVGYKWTGHGINLPGGFAEYCAYPQAKVFQIHNLSDVDATLIEPASCACHGLDKIRPRLGSSVLMFGAGPTGLVRQHCDSLPLIPYPLLPRTSQTEINPFPRCSPNSSGKTVALT